MLKKIFIILNLSFYVSFTYASDLSISLDQDTKKYLNVLKKYPFKLDRFNHLKNTNTEWFQSIWRYVENEKKSNFDLINNETGRDNIINNYVNNLAVLSKLIFIKKTHPYYRDISIKEVNYSEHCNKNDDPKSESVKKVLKIINELIDELGNAKELQLTDNISNNHKNSKIDNYIANLYIHKAKYFSYLEHMIDNLDESWRILNINLKVRTPINKIFLADIIFNFNYRPKKLNKPSVRWKVNTSIAVAKKYAKEGYDGFKTKKKQKNTSNNNKKNIDIGFNNSAVSFTHKDPGIRKRKFNDIKNQTNNNNIILPAMSISNIINNNDNKNLNTVSIPNQTNNNNIILPAMSISNVVNNNNINANNISNFERVNNNYIDQNKKYFCEKHKFYEFKILNINSIQVEDKEGASIYYTKKHLSKNNQNEKILQGIQKSDKGFLVVKIKNNKFCPCFAKLKEYSKKGIKIVPNGRVAYISPERTNLNITLSN
jgi:hypothetical protein